MSINRLITGALAAVIIAAPSAASLASSVASNSSAADPSTIQITRGANQIVLTFQGTLESAETIAGPWIAVSNAMSPRTEDVTGPQRFYRTRQTGPVSIFASRSVVDLTITGPLQQHFDLAFAGTPDGIFPPVREKPWFDGEVRLEGLSIPAGLRVRGNSSLQECPFPKLKLKVSSKDREGTPFYDAREIKIGTHCAEGGTGNIGRLRDERAGFREALAYEIMDSMGFTSPRVRRARIEYHDTTAPAVNPNGGNDASIGAPGDSPHWPITRQAALFDDVEVVAARLGGRALSDEEVAALTKAGFDEELITGLRLLHSFLGNWDYALSPDGQELWNTEVIELPNKQLTPMAGDFDLASFVTGRVRLMAPAEYHPELPELERQALYSIEQAQARTSPEIFASAAERFKLHRASLETLIASAEVDEAGRANALAHLNAFYTALSTVSVKP